MGRVSQAGGKNHARQRKETADLEVLSLRLGRYAYQGGIPHYSANMLGVWREETTMPECERKLRQQGRDLERLKRQGKISTTDPRHMKKMDVRIYVASIKHLDPETQRKLIGLMNGYLVFFKNRVLDDMIKEKEIRIPKAPRKAISTIEPEDLEKIFTTVESMKGWTGAVCRGMVSLYFGTGARPKEVRLSENRDLDLARSRFYVRHPKGEGNWGVPQWVDIIRGDMLPMIEQYSAERAEYVKYHDLLDAPALFPCLNNGTGYYSDKRFQIFKGKIAKASGVDFTLKDFRSTLCTLTIKGDLSREPAMSVQLRNEPRTMRKYYADIQRASAGEQLKDAWKECPVRRVAPFEGEARPVTPKNPPNDSRFGVTGYA